VYHVVRKTQLQKEVPQAEAAAKRVYSGDFQMNFLLLDKVLQKPEVLPQMFLSNSSKIATSGCAPIDIARGAVGKDPLNFTIPGMEKKPINVEILKKQINISKMALTANDQLDNTPPRVPFDINTDFSCKYAQANQWVKYRATDYSRRR